MPMFRFWASDRGCEQTVVDSDSHSSLHLAKPHLQHTLSDATATILSSKLQSPKRRRESADDDDVSLTPAAPAKRLKLGPESADEISLSYDPPSVTSPAPDAMESARDEIRHHFGLEILLKHDELRLINQELAKCQAALEQLRRCHLMPYPVNCPTPDQMLDISSGKGPAVQGRPGEAVPRWASPFGVADGPYARHYAKWLIPDPAFDGIQPEWSFSESTRSRASFAEDRSMRNSFGEPGSAVKGRPGRGSVGQKLQALSSGYPQPKEKAGPCVLKRADGKTVKLVCLDCHRDNFSSTQGFINHCRIAHKREFKSHEEAAVQSGQPIEAGETPTVVTASEEKTSVTCSRSTPVHPFARPDMSEQEAYVALRSRIAASLALYHQGKLPGVGQIPSLSTTARPTSAKVENPAKFDAAPETPYLSRLMQSRKFSGNLGDIVADAKTKISLDDITPGEESEDSDAQLPVLEGTHDGMQVRSPVVMRMPARSTKSPAPPGPLARPTSSKAHASHISFVSSPDSTGSAADKDPRGILSDEDVDMEEANLSPNTLVSNNAPSLVSDDGEYDDSDEGCSVSGASDNLDTESVSDVAEITLDDEHDPRSLRRGSSGVSGAVKLRKGDSKHVTFVSPVDNTTKERTRKP